MKEIIINTPLNPSQLSRINIGDIIKINGTILTARDATLFSMVKNDKKKKMNDLVLKNQIIYFAGPAPGPGNKMISSCGPTTSSRMEPYILFLLKQGVKVFIGKGPVSQTFLTLLRKNNAVYLLATGGAGVFLAKHIKQAEIIAFKELGPEAVYQLKVENFPTIACGIKGKSLIKI
ncbi:MAG: fumarate hydratase C-terminal domain-containing protein [Spirochaetes bacterium]|nr:fumarate hydratase C-terminal domain-containing protein [Spirochaetota bacterium]